MGIKVRNMLSSALPGAASGQLRAGVGALHGWEDAEPLVSISHRNVRSSQTDLGSTGSETGHSGSGHRTWPGPEDGRRPICHQLSGTGNTNIKQILKLFILQLNW